MITLFLVFLPCAVCLVALATYLLKLNRLTSDALLSVLAAVTAFYFFMDAHLVTHLSVMYGYEIPLIILAKGASLCLLPLTLLWLQRLSQVEAKRYDGIVAGVLFAIPVVMVIMLFTIYFLMGTDEAEQYLLSTFYSGRVVLPRAMSPLYTAHVYVAYWLYHAILLMEAVAMLVLTGRRLRLRRRDSEWSARDMYIFRIDVAMLALVLVMMVRIIIGPVNLQSLPVVSGILSLAISVALYVIFASAVYMGLIDNPAVNRDTLRAVQQARQNELRDNFERLMTEQQPFLKQGLTIEDVALMLATNRTYVSRMLHDEYGCTFPEYMTERRLAFAKQFMLDHPLEIQEEIAFRSGFANAPIFNKKFREQEGITPREWLSRHRREE